ncbi:MAG: hypothetical protein S4CHLAM2_18470 [Chlamydiales bacterium]|nr:hypothetical protein [Chlamydiales bacterium]
MDTDDFKAKWNDLKGSAKEKWGELTDDDIKNIDGKKDQLIAALQERYHYAKEKAQAEFDSWFQAVKDKLKK